ncbi:MAG: hypothetical protein Q9191_008172 [Dirinaria sp. TL-2023a]
MHSVQSHRSQYCDSGYCSDISTGSISKPRHRRKTTHKETSPTSSLTEKQSLDNTAIASYPLPRTRKPSAASQSSTAQPSIRNHSRRNSTPFTSRHHSTACSRRSSFLVRPPTETCRASTIPRHNRSTSTSTINYLLYENPFLPPTARNPEIRPPTPIVSRKISFPGPTNDNTCLDPRHVLATKESPQPRYVNFVPASTIDWTLPSTHRQEHERLARSSSSSRGIRTLWGKLRPWKFGNADAYAEADGGCVRRYRQGSSKAKEGEDEDESVGFPEKRSQEKIHGWTCFGIEKGCIV